MIRRKPKRSEGSAASSRVVRRTEASAIGRHRSFATVSNWPDVAHGEGQQLADRSLSRRVAPTHRGVSPLGAIGQINRPQEAAIDAKSGDGSELDEAFNYTCELTCEASNPDPEALEFVEDCLWLTHARARS